MNDGTERGGVALIVAILALLLAPGAYIFAHPHPIGLHAWVASISSPSDHTRQG
ncbi:MAG TPA: hypothetical protein VHX64_07475 [Caulobacteraceae bacterium]|jgi:hypothetical protein|nr:hypothetical protein [Caulobacteraceae bacterium]